MFVSAEVRRRTAEAVGDSGNDDARIDGLRVRCRHAGRVDGTGTVRLECRTLRAGDHVARIDRVEVGEEQVIHDPRAGLIRRVAMIGERAERLGALGDGVVGDQVVVGVAVERDARGTAGPDHVVVDHEVLAEVVQVDAYRVVLDAVVDPVVGDDSALAVRPPGVGCAGVVVQHNRMVQVAVRDPQLLGLVVQDQVASGAVDAAVIDDRSPGRLHLHRTVIGPHVADVVNDTVAERIALALDVESRSGRVGDVATADRVVVTMDPVDRIGRHAAGRCG